MSLPSIRFVFNRKSTATESKAAVVQLEVLNNRKRRYYDTGVRLFVDQWDIRARVVHRADAAQLNRRLNEIENAVLAYTSNLLRDGSAFRWEAVDRIFGRRVGKTFIDFVEERIKSRSDIRESTRRTQSKLVTSLRTFGHIIGFEDLTRANIAAYNSWLHEQGYMQSTANSYHKFLKTYINEAIRRELLSENPYSAMRISHGKPARRRFLETGEIEVLAAAELGEIHLRRVRDLFLFQCYTGLAYADLSAFDFSKVQERDCGARGKRYFFTDYRVKSDIRYEIMLMAPAMAILKRYDFKLPVISNQKYNAYLKDVAKAAGLNIALTSHMGRHTFATMCLNKGVPIEAVSKMLGHTNIQTTQIYARLVNKTLEQAFLGLEEKL